MKIAFCFSGQLRTGVLASPNVLNYIGELLSDTTFFCHTWDINTPKPKNMSGVSRDPYPTVETADKFIQTYNIHVSQWELEYWTDQQVTRQQEQLWLPMYHSFKRSIELVKNYEKDQNFKFDLIIKYRPDLLLDSRRKLSVDLVNTLASVDFNLDNKILVENYHDSLKMDDVYFVARPEVMYKVANLVNMIEETRIDNENYHLQSLNITPYPILHSPHNGYTIYREECTDIDPLNWDECFNCDHGITDERK